MAPLKPFLLATAGIAAALVQSQSTCSGDSCETGDQTALLQSHLSRKSEIALQEHSSQSSAFFPKLSSLNDPRQRKSALLEMEKTAVQLANMDRSEATPVVITVCKETADLLNTTVLYAIIEEDAADRAAVQSAYDAFFAPGGPEDLMRVARQKLEEAEREVSLAADSLAACRTIEIETCDNETVCTLEIDDHCELRDRLEIELQEIDTEIHNSWCLNGEVRTSTEFRTTTVEIFHRYTEKWNALTNAQEECEIYEEQCSTTLTTYIERATMCNTKQSTLQMESCEYQHIAATDLQVYQNAYNFALNTYNDVVAHVMIMEADRKVEWDVLTRVICLLLTLTQEATEEGDIEHGLVSSEETAARIERCWTDDVDVSHLDIEYPEPPPMLSLPELPPIPCTADYDDMYNIGPPAACAALVELHNTQATSECSCVVDEIADQGLVLGHYLLVDPAVPMNIAGGEWTIQIEDMVFAGALSAIHHGDFSRLSSEMLTTAELDPADEDYTGEIKGIAWAYPSTVANWEGAMSLGQRFASRGGMVFLNEANQVIDIRELASSSGALGQPVSATLSFAAAQEITEAQVEAACPGQMHAVLESSRDYAQGAREYCWVMGGEHIPACANGCFIYNMVYGKVAFPLISGMHIAHSDDVHILPIVEEPDVHILPHPEPEVFPLPHED